MRFILPIVLILLGTGAGVAAGIFLLPPKAEMESIESAETEPTAVEPETSPENSEYVKMNNQFLVPVIASEVVNALVVLSISLEVEQGSSAAVYQREPKLRDDFLQVLFDHANIGGFDGPFTETRRMSILRQSLLDVAKKILGDSVSGILITEIARQDV